VVNDEADRPLPKVGDKVLVHSSGHEVEAEVIEVRPTSVLPIRVEMRTDPFDPDWVYSTYYTLEEVRPLPRERKARQAQR
jgi:hypothetical protein